MMRAENPFGLFLKTRLPPWSVRQLKANRTGDRHPLPCLTKVILRMQNKLGGTMESLRFIPFFQG